MMLEISFKKTLGHFILEPSFQAKKGVLGILGPSGCGKSMTLKAISGLYSPDLGTITLNGHVLFSSKNKINIPPRLRNIGYLFQNYALFPHLTVHQNIAYGIKDLKADLRNKKAADIICRMQLEGLENHYPHQLSGGQQQRAALARTLIKDPDLLLLDEPFSALDSHVKYLLEKELISIIQKHYNGIVLLVTHNIEEAYRICDHIMVMDEGQIFQIGTKDEIIYTPANLTAARITGCKNFLDATVLETHEDYYILKSHDLLFKAAKTDQPINKQMTAGIRAHHIKISPMHRCLENTFECDIIEKIEGVFSATILVNCCGCPLQVEVSKTSCPHLSEIKYNKIKLHIPPDKIFLINNA